MMPLADKNITKSAPEPNHIAKLTRARHSRKAPKYTMNDTSVQFELANWSKLLNDNYGRVSSFRCPWLFGEGNCAKTVRGRFDDRLREIKLAPVMRSTPE